MPEFTSTVTQTQRQKVDLIRIENALATAEISLFGGQVLSFRPVTEKPRDLLWVSPQASWDMSKPVRGGIPVCWPWFGQASEPDLPAHGYVRKQSWTLDSVMEEQQQTTLSLSPSSTVGPGFSGATRLELSISIGRELTISLGTRNTGSKDLKLNCALHSYFHVSDICQITLKGITGKYRDKTRNWAVLDTPEPYMFTEETDRIHQYASPEVLIADPEYARKTTIRSSGHDSIVVWNPWHKAASMPDMSADDYKNMICVETAITRGYILQPGSIHHLVQTIGLNA